MLQFPDRYLALREIDGLPDAAFRLHMLALFWTDVNGTGGRIPASDLCLVAGRVRNPARLAAECVRRGAWHEAGHECGSPDCPAPGNPGGGWVIHDFLRLTEKESAKDDPPSGRSAAGRLGNHRRWHEQRGVTDPSCPYCSQAEQRSPSESPGDRTGESGSDENSDREATPDRSDQINHRSSVIALVRPDAREDIAPGRISDELAAASAIALEARTGQPATDVQAREAAARILDRARQAGIRVRNPVRYVMTAIGKEPDVRGSLLAAAPPPLEQILDGIRRDQESGSGQHEYEPGPNDRCRQCGMPKPNQRHQAARSA